LAIWRVQYKRSPSRKKSQFERSATKKRGAAVNPDPNSPLLIIGDSHTLVFHDFLAEKSGLLDQVAYETGFAPDLIGTRGSGATSVRVSLYRRARKDPDYLAKKKMIVCVSPRANSPSPTRAGTKCLWVSKGCQRSTLNTQRSTFKGRFIGMLNVDVEGWAFFQAVS